jgi:hypothetical protein
MRVNIYDWSVSHIVTDGFDGFFSGAVSHLPCADKFHLVSGYRDEVATARDETRDIISREDNIRKQKIFIFTFI